MRQQYLRVFDHTNKLVSHTPLIPGATHEEQLESYARGCGWESAAGMRRAYPLDQFTLVLDEEHP